MVLKFMKKRPFYLKIMHYKVIFIFKQNVSNIEKTFNLLKNIFQKVMFWHVDSSGAGIWYSSAIVVQFPAPKFFL